MRSIAPAVYPGLATLALLVVAVLGAVSPFGNAQSFEEGALINERNPNPVLNRSAPNAISLSTGSPFSPYREPYTRPVIAQEPAPPPPRRDVILELVGIVEENGERSAVVLMDGVERMLRVGSETEAGRVVFVGLDSVRFEGEQARTISLFD